MFDPGSEIFINYDKTEGLQSNQFIEGSYYKSPDGELFFGGINGYTAFFPEKISRNDFNPGVVLTQFRVFNKPVSVKNSPLLKKPIWNTDELLLSYKDAIISFDFTALNYRFPEKNKYMYMLEGFEKSWNFVNSNRRSATYTNLTAGAYIFRVKGSNNDGIWSEHEVALKITVTPPWWKTWWFQVIWIGLIVVSSIIFFQWRVYAVNRRADQLEIEIEKRTYDLQLSQTRYQELFDTIENGVAVYRAVDDGDDYIFLEFNKGGERIEGVDSKNLIGKRITRIFPGTM